MSLWQIPVLVTVLFLTPSITEGDNCRGFPEPGNLQLAVLYGDTIAVTVHWQNASALSTLQNYVIVACLDNEKLEMSGMMTAPDNTEFETLDYVTFIDRSLPISVNFSNVTCTSNSSQEVTFPSIISEQPRVEQEGENATFTVTFAMMESPSVMFDVVSTAIVEINVTATQGNADLIHVTSMFPLDFPNVTSTQILITNLTEGTEYNYTVRVLTSTASNAVEIPHRVSGAFPMPTPSIPTEGSDVGLVVGGTVGGVVGVVIIAGVVVCVVVGVVYYKKTRKVNLYTVENKEAKNKGVELPDVSAKNQEQ